MTTYYNELAHFAAQWLRELITAGHIAPGDVDERSIEDVCPEDLTGYTQCHFFAGIGVWAYALRLAGWPDDRPVWTGSCPCQPFSPAGKRAGFADPRHLWPAFGWLIRQCRPVTVLGEQVAGRNGLAWLDALQSELEGANYAIGHVVAPACGFGAPHQRRRLYWVANSECVGLEGAESKRVGDGLVDRNVNQGGVNRVGHPSGIGQQEEHQDAARCGSGGREEGGTAGLHTSGDPGNLANAKSKYLAREMQESGGQSRVGRQGVSAGGCSDAGRPSPTNGFWRDVDWLFCRDGKWRPVEPGTFPLAHRAPARVGRLRGYGNAIVAPQAAAFIKAVTEAVPEKMLDR